MTFLAYLSSQNRLLPFINRGSTIPTRKEFADYLSWAAAYVQEKGVGVKYGHQVVGLDDRQDGTIAVRMKRVDADEETTVIAREYLRLKASPRLLNILTFVGCREPCYIPRRRTTYPGRHYRNLSPCIHHP